MEFDRIDKALNALSPLAPKPPAVLVESMSAAVNAFQKFTHKTDPLCAAAGDDDAAVHALFAEMLRKFRAEGNTPDTD